MRNSFHVTDMISNDVRYLCGKDELYVKLDYMGSYITDNSLGAELRNLQNYNESSIAAHASQSLDEKPTTVALSDKNKHNTSTSTVILIRNNIIYTNYLCPVTPRDNLYTDKREQLYDVITTGTVWISS